MGKLYNIHFKNTTQLSVALARNGLGLAIVGFNPLRARYDLDPPLNPWEQTLRETDRDYADDAAHVTTLSYGPDINLSKPGWTAEQSLDATRKLNWYAPYIIPFSFSSPFHNGQIWQGYSKRTHERAGLRPTVKLFLTPGTLADFASRSQLAHPARLPGEEGRIEFKAFDACPSLALLTACCHLLEGICLAEDLTGRSEQSDVALYRRAAWAGFNDAAIRDAAGEVLSKASAALLQAGHSKAVAALSPLRTLLAERRTPAHDFVAAYRATGLMYKPGGHAIDV